MKKLSFLMLVAGIFLFYGKVFGIDLTKSTEETVKKKAEKKTFPLGGFVILDNAVGFGSFVDHEYEKRPLYNVTFTFYPRYKWTKYIYTALRLDISQEIVTNADSTTTKKHQTLLSDLSFRTAHTKIYKAPWNIIIGGYFDILFPTSLASQYANRYFTLRGALQASKQFGPVMFKYTFRFTKYFSKYTSKTVNTEEAGNVVAPRPYGAEILSSGLVATGSNNYSFGILNDFYFEWSIFNTGLTLIIDYIVYNNWTYRSYPDDEYKDENAVSGRGQSDTTIGTIELDYMLTKNLILALGTYTMQPPKTYNNESFRIPFLNFKNLAGNYSVVYFDIIGVF